MTTATQVNPRELKGKALREWQETEILRHVSLVAMPDQVIELRIPKVDGRKNRTAAGYFDDWDALAKEGAKWSGRAAGVYITLNPVNPSLLARAANKVKDWSEFATGDGDITRRLCFLIDADPERPSGISSTDEEHDMALARSLAIQAWLTDMGWPQPLRADSGNGGHLVYGLDLPNEPDMAQLLQRCLQAINAEWGDEAVKIDTTVYNASRISKLYGTAACKGDSTPERPHRLSRILSAPETLEPVAPSLLHELAMMAPDANEPEQTDSAPTGPTFDVEEFIRRHSATLNPSSVKMLSNGTRRWRIDCIHNSEHKGDAVIGQRTNGALWAKCSHDSCQGRWGWKDLRERFEPKVHFHTNGTGPSRSTTAAQDGGGKKSDGDKEKGPTQAELLFAMASERVNLFTAQDGVAYAIVPYSGRNECYPLRSGAFRGYLAGLYHDRIDKIPGAQAIQDAIGLLEWNARDTERRIYVRVAPHGDKVYIDRGTPAWDAIEIDKDGWRIIAKPPVAFRRSKGMGALPIPTAHDDVSGLREFLNIDDEHWPLLAGWALAAYYPHGPFPVLALTGEAGTAKTTATRVLKSIIDPSTAALRAAPKNVEDLMIASNNSWVLAYDNLSGLGSDTSDALCRIATGGGYTTRALYTNGEEYLIDVMRPIILNGIDSIVTRGDLMDRALAVELLPISESMRMDEASFWRKFEAQRPAILGAFLTALSSAIGNLPYTQLPRMPRMADFAKLVSAGEGMLQLDPGGFLSVYDQNRTDATTTILDSSPIVRALREVVLINSKWEGTPAELLDRLMQAATETEKQSKQWPNSPAWLSRSIKQLAPTLRAGRIIDARDVRKNGVRKWTIERM